MTRIVISSGHGKYIRGAEGYLDEVDEARRVVARVGELLNDAGVKATTYNDDVSTSQNENLNRIVDFHNSQTRDLDVSVHFNASETTSNPMGAECWHYSQEDLAASVASAIAEAGRLKDRGPKQTGDLFFLNHTEEPAILIEVCFVDSSADADLYRQNFDAICSAIAAAISGEEIEAGPTPPKPPDPDDDVLPTLKKGSTGSEVVVLQKCLGVLETDGNFGPTTETWVKALQAACSLKADGVVGPITWEQVLDLKDRADEGGPLLPDKLAEGIYSLAQQSEIAEFSWPDRGVAPPGYIAGMALSFAYAVRRAQDGDAAVEAMAQEAGDPDTDALAWYASEFKALGMYNNVAGLEPLRHLFVMMIGLGPRESSAKYCEGRDLSADNVDAETAEAGMFQTSWNINYADDAIEPLLEEFWDNPNGFLPEFKEGIVATKNNLDSYGSGAGARYQFLSRFCPLFHVMVTGVGMRTLRQHWGPINRREVTLKREADKLLKDVQELVEAVA